MRKLTILTAVLALCMFSLSVSAEESKKVLLGDMNADGEITLEDTKLTLYRALNINNKKGISEQEDIVGDINGDGEIDLVDVKLNLQTALNITNTYKSTYVSWNEDNAESMQETMKIVSVTKKDKTIELLCEDENQLASILVVDESIAVKKDGQPVSKEELKENMTINFDVTYVLEVYPAILKGCTYINIL